MIILSTRAFLLCIFCHTCHPRKDLENNKLFWLLDWMHNWNHWNYCSIYSHTGTCHQRKLRCYIPPLIVAAFRFTCMRGKYISFHSDKCHMYSEENWAPSPEMKQYICRKESISPLSETYFKGRRLLSRT